MVKYYGRARQRIGSVNTNQIGLNMSGCPSKVGRQGYLSRYIARRAQCNQKFCGPVYYHGVLWSWNSGRCVAKAPRGQSFNSGVGHKSTPRFACGDTCAAELTLEAAFDIIFKYFSALVYPNGYVPVLVGTKETLKSDLGDALMDKLKPIQHLEPGNTYYDNAPPAVKKAILSVNSRDLTFKIKGNLRKHIVGLASAIDRSVLYDNGFGIQLKLSPTSVVIAFGDGGDNCGGLVENGFITKENREDPDAVKTICDLYKRVRKYCYNHLSFQGISPAMGVYTLWPGITTTQLQEAPGEGYPKFGKDGYQRSKTTYNPPDIVNFDPDPTSWPLQVYIQDNEEDTQVIYTNIFPVNDACGVYKGTHSKTDIILSIALYGKMNSAQIQEIEESILGTDFLGNPIKLAGPNWKQQPGDSEDSLAADNWYYYYCPLATGTRSSTSTIDQVKNVISRKVKAHEYIQCIDS